MRAAALWMGVYAACLGSFAFCQSAWPALIAQFAIGLTYFALMTSLQTLVQERVSDSHRGRVMSLFQLAWAGLVPWGSLGVGATADRVGVVATLAAAAAICAAYAATVWLASLRSRGPANAG